MSDVTRILNAIERGDARATDQLWPLVYEELRLLAARKLAQERPGQTLQATALVHEAYLRLVGDEPHTWNSRGHFFAAAAEAKRNHRMAGRTQTIGELFEQDQQAALPLPPRAFDPFVPETAKVDKYDTNRYSVPRRWAFETVTIKAYVDRIEVVSGTSVLARQARSYARGEWIVQP